MNYIVFNIYGCPAVGLFTVGATPLGFGETVSGSIDLPDELDTYTFSADAGDEVLIRADKTSGDLSPHVRLYAPDDTDGNIQCHCVKYEA